MIIPDLVAIDLGSNSFHMVRVQHRDGELITRYREKSRVRLAAGLDAQCCLDEASIRRGLAALSRFEAQVAGLPSQNVRVVATHTLRVATNAADFLQRARALFPHSIEIISGPEEAALTYAGVAYEHAIDGHATVVDIGGGSTEVAQGIGGEVKMTASCPVGCVVYQERFFRSPRPTPEAFALARQQASECLRSMGLALDGGGRVIGSSGTIKACAQVLLATTGESVIRASGLLRLEALLCEGRLSDAYDLSPERLDVLPAGVAILQAVFQTWAISSMEFSHVALREGVLLSLLPRPPATGVRAQTRKQLEQRFKVDRRHARRVVRAVTRLLDDLDVNDPWVRRLTLDAARLAELGQAIQYAGFQHHGAYVLRHTDMAGYPPEDREAIAALIACHRKKIITPEALDAQFRVALVALRLGALSQSARDNACEVPAISRAGDRLEVSAVPALTVEIAKEAKWLAILGLTLVAV